MRNRDGFSLVELIIVVVVIGILAAIAIPQFLGVGKNSRQIEAEPILKQMFTLQETHYERYNRYAQPGATGIEELRRVGYADPQTLQYFSPPRIGVGDDQEFCVWMDAVNASRTHDVEIRGRRSPTPGDGTVVEGDCS